MKTLISLLVVFSAFLANAQTPAIINSLTTTPVTEVKSDQVNTKKGLQPALVMNVVGDEDSYNREWKNYMATKYKVEFKKSSGFGEARGILIPEWHPDTISIFYKVEPDGDFIKMSMITECRGIMLNESENAASISSIKTAMKAQAADFYLKYYDKVIMMQQKEYDQLGKEQEKLVSTGVALVKDVDNTNKNIATSETTINTLNTNIATAEIENESLNQQLESKKREQEQLKKELENINSQVTIQQKEYERYTGTGSSNDPKKADKAMKDLQSVRDDQVKQQKKITTSNESISKLESSLIANKDTRNKYSTKVKEQEMTIANNKTTLTTLDQKIVANKTAQEEKAAQIEASRQKLEQLKSARSGVIAQ